jgi:hypothetical protein
MRESRIYPAGCERLMSVPGISLRSPKGLFDFAKLSGRRPRPKDPEKHFSSRRLTSPDRDKA